MASDGVDDALAMFGLRLEEASKGAATPEVCEVWPTHVDALNLFLVCMGQLQMSIGGMGPAYWSAAQSVNLGQEARWQGLHGSRQAQVVRQYRVIEQEALALLNDREAKAAQKS